MATRHEDGQGLSYRVVLLHGEGDGCLAVGDDGRLIEDGGCALELEILQLGGVLATEVADEEIAAVGIGGDDAIPSCRQLILQRQQAVGVRSRVGRRSCMR